MNPDWLPALRKKAAAGEKLAMITVYDFPSAETADAAGADLLLVGDSLGVTVLGYENTHTVTLDEMTHHLRAARRGVKKSPLLCDMPINTYRTAAETLANARTLMNDGAMAVKLEGCQPDVVRALVAEGIPVMGHIGLIPQSFKEYKVQGKEPEDAARLAREAAELAGAGCFSIVLELIAAPLAQKITAELSIPTIGIGSGPHCGGQVLVYNDLLGIFERFKPKFARRFRELRKEMTGGCADFVREVKAGSYPANGEWY
ncbi:MAG: 3-methyl-2-oxobutanoate hydroxymethyltransferase [Fibrobacterota bacterium]